MPSRDADLLISKHGEETVSFISYYKYTFTYGNSRLRVHAGGDKDNIYRCSLLPEMTVQHLLAEAGGDSDYLYWVELDKDGNFIES